MSHGVTRILHLSDLHFGANHAFRAESAPDVPTVYGQSLLDRIVADANTLGIRPDVIVVSGDSTSSARLSEFTSVREFLKGLLQAFELTSKETLIVPGNHDVGWRADGEVSDGEFQSFVSSFYGIPAGNVFPRVLAVNNVALVGIDTTRLRSQEFGGVGAVGIDQMRAAVSRLETEAPGSPFRILVQHHHLMPVAWAEPPASGQSHSYTMDAVTVLGGMQAANFHMALHGHQHHGFAATVHLSYKPGRAILVLGAPSAGSRDLPPQVSNGHQWIEIEGSRIRVLLRSLTDGQEYRGTTTSFLIQPGGVFAESALPQGDFGREPSLREIRSMLRGAVGRIEAGVAVSYGPRGGLRMGQRGGAVMELRDGRLIIESLVGADPGQARLLRSLIEVCQEHERVAGDGRKSLALLWAHSVRAALDAVESGALETEVASGLRAAAAAACEHFESDALRLDGAAALRVARAASGGDEILGRVVTEAIDAAGERGMVEMQLTDGEGAPSVSTSQRPTFLTVGTLARYHIEMGTSVPISLPGALVAVARGPIRNLGQIAPILEKAASDNKPLLLVTDSLEGDAYATVADNVKRGIIRCVTLKLSAQRDGEEYRDIAMACQARLVERDEISSGSRGIPVEALGECSAATVYGDRVEVELSMEQQDALLSYAESLRRAVADEENEYRMQVVGRRIALMLGRHVQVTIAAVSEAERQRLGSFVGDALRSVTSARRKGVLPGGGAAYLRAAVAIRSRTWSSESERMGAEALASGLSALFVNLVGADRAAGLRSQLELSPSTSYDIVSGSVVESRAEGPLDSVLMCCSLVRRAADAVARAVTTRTLELPAGSSAIGAAPEAGA